MTWQRQLLLWFKDNQRDMPWRSNPDPYYVWVSEIMLQQTQVATVIPYFNRFIDAFPNVYVLAEASSDEVLKKWEGLGYYSRARYLHAAAKKVVETYQGVLPSSYKELQTLSGIGPYCAAAITSIAFGNPVPVVDGNVLRVFTRFWGLYEDIKKDTTRKMLFDRLRPEIAHYNPSDFNQAIMELGALICSPTQPQCTKCPLETNCVAFNTNIIEKIPIKTKSKPTPHYNIAVGVIWKNNTLLIGKRKESQMLGGLWEFPGGKQKAKESLNTTLLREIKEETGLEVKAEHPYCTIKHAYSHFKITLHVFKCTYKKGIPHPYSTDELRWVRLEEIDNFAFPKANSKALSIIKEATKNHTL